MNFHHWASILMMKMVWLNLQLIIPSLLSVASVPENMASKSQDTPLEVGDIPMNVLLPASDLEPTTTHPEHSTEVNDPAISNVTSKGKKCQCASSGTARSKPLIFIVLSSLNIRMATEAIVTRSGAKSRAAAAAIHAEATADDISKGNNGDHKDVSKWIEISLLLESSYFKRLFVIKKNLG